MANQEITVKFPVKCNGKLYLPGQTIQPDHPAYNLLKKHSHEFSEVKDYGGEPSGDVVAKAYKQTHPTKKPTTKEVVDKTPMEDQDPNPNDSENTEKPTKPLNKMNKAELIKVAVAKGLVEGTDFTSETKNADLIALIEG